MPLAYVLDEHLRGSLWPAILQHNRTSPHLIDATRVGDPSDLALGSSDPEILLWAERNGRILVSLDRKTLTIMLTAPPTQVAAGSVAGLQYPITIIEGHGITDANGTAWDLAGSADRVFGRFGWPIRHFGGGRVAADAFDAIDLLELGIHLADELI